MTLPQAVFHGRRAFLIDFSGGPDRNGSMITRFFPSSLGRVCYYEIEPAANTDLPVRNVFLLHGLPTNKSLWVTVAERLAPNFRVIIPDLLGYGQSQKSPRYISHREQARVLDELRRSLDISEIYLAAHDLGASVAIDYMGEFGRNVPRLLLLSPPVYPEFAPPWIIQLARLPLVSDILLQFFREAMLEEGIKTGLVHKEKLTKDILEKFIEPFNGPDGREVLRRVVNWGEPAEVFRYYPTIIRRVEAPTLVIQGAQDPYIPMEQVNRLERDLKRGKLEIISEGAHFLPLDVPDRVADDINRFFNE